MAASRCNAEPHSVYVSESINPFQDPRWLLLSVMLSLIVLLFMKALTYYRIQDGCFSV